MFGFWWFTIELDCSPLLWSELLPQILSLGVGWDGVELITHLIVEDGDVWLVAILAQPEVEVWVENLDQEVFLCVERTVVLSFALEVKVEELAGYLCLESIFELCTGSGSFVKVEEFSWDLFLDSGYELVTRPGYTTKRNY